MNKGISKKTSPQVDEYLRANKTWRKELQQLRTIVLDCGLAEEVKWGSPCYTFQGKNVVMLSGFKEYCALSFMKGALLKDGKKILVKPGENTRAGRLIRFTSVQEIVDTQEILKFYIHEAIQVEEAGLKVDFAKDRELDIPQELKDKFEEHPPLQAAFEALMPGRQRGYLLYFSGAKLRQRPRVKD